MIQGFCPLKTKITQFPADSVLIWRKDGDPTTTKGGRS